MPRLVLLIIGVAVLAHGFAWLADQPGTILVHWGGYELKASLFHAVVMLAFLIGLSILTWSLVSALWRSPASLGAFFNRRRQMRGLEALSGGMIAIGAGDRANATRFAVQARKALPNEPMTQLLRAQAAQLSGDRSTARRMYEAMLAQPDTEQLGLRGLFLEAEREGEKEAARQFAERSVDLNPQLSWAVDALFELQCKDHDWAGALKTLGVAKKHQQHDKTTLDRRRAVLMTARALALEESDPNRAMNLAVEAHHLSHDLVPAAVLAGRMLASRGHTKRAAKIIERTWRRSPQPELAFVYAHVRPGDSPRDRLDRVKRLAQLHPHSIETPVAIATAAIDARDWTTARRALEQVEPARQTQRLCTLMARIEGEEQADKGRVREWLARAVHAPRDPAWVADGVVSDKWAPVSPVTGAFDAFEWKAPADALDGADAAVLAAKLEELVKLGAPLPEAAKAVVEKVVEANVAGAGAKPVNRVEPRARAEAETVVRSSGGARPSREAQDIDVVTGPGSAGGAAAGGGGAGGRNDPQPRTARPHEVRTVSPAQGGRASVEVVSGPALSARQAASKTGASAGVSPAGSSTPSGPASVRPAAPAAGNPGNGSARPQPVPAPADKKPLEANMYITPRAPDDPGVSKDDKDIDGQGGPPKPRVASGQR